MNDSYLFIWSIVVFSLMAIGLVLTVVEFRYGAPSKQDKAAKEKLGTGAPPKERTK